MNTLDYKSPGQKTSIRWWVRYAVFVPLVVACYLLLVWSEFLAQSYVFHPYMLHANAQPSGMVLILKWFYSAIGPAMAFPVFFMFHNDGGVQQLWFFAINALFWGISITALWHGVVVVRNRKMGRG